MTDIELALRALAPAPSRIDRDRLMFEAGARSLGAADRRRWFWPGVAAGLAAIVAGESILLASRPTPRVVERLVVVREPLEPAAPVAERAIPSEGVNVGREAADPIEEFLAARWETAGDYRRGLAPGRAGLGTPSTRLDRGADDRPDGRKAPRPASVGELRRSGIAELLNPGGRS